MVYYGLASRAGKIVCGADAVKESIIKFIQIRYGYNCWEIEDIDDLQVIDEPFFTPMGIMNLDNDKLRYDSIFGENHM